MSELLQSGHHPDADQLNAFVENALPPHELEQTLAHLAICPDCREIVALSLPPVEQPLPRPARKPWFFRWNLAWPAVAAVAAVVLVIVFVRNITSTRNAVGVPTQVAISNSPAPLQPLATPQISNPNPPSPPDSRPPASRHSAVPSDATVVANSAKAKATVDTKSVEGSFMPKSGRSGLAQTAPASGTQPIHGQFLDNAAGVGAAVGSPQKRALAVPTDQFQQSPFNSSGAASANASDRLQAPKLAPPPLAAPAPVAATNQTVGVNSGSVVTLPSTNSDIQLSQAGSILSHSLPSNLPVLSMVSSSHQVLAIDTEHSLFTSSDDGIHWKAVPAQWQGRAVKVDLASSIPSNKISAGAVAAEGRPGANFGAIGGPVPAQTTATSATLTGTVTDATGAVIPDASVIVGNPATPNVRTVKTDRTGRYLIDGLSPGSYQVAAEARGFNKQQLNITLTASQQSLANLTLSIGQATETVTVSASSESIATLSVARKNKVTRSSASQSPPIFEITTDTGEHWTSTDGHTWKHN
jgi:hypothetical protein